MKTDLARALALLWLLSFWPAAYFVAGNFDQIADYNFEGVGGILSVSAAIVYEQFGSIHILDLKTGAHARGTDHRLCGPRRSSTAFSEDHERRDSQCIHFTHWPTSDL